jgi:asparagine synthase (glutamine-hydrolysing)
LLADMRELVRQLDSPLISPAIVPLHRVLRRARDDGIKVLYDGQGADELLAGYDNQFYPQYLHTLLSAPLGRGGWGERTGILARALAGMTRTQALWTARYLAPWLHPLYRRAIAADSVLSADFRTRGAGPAAAPPHYADPLNEALYQAHSHRILPGLLHYGDAVSMANSIEYRLPYMDYRLVEYCFGLPAGEKIGEGYTKRVLRSALAGIMIDKVRLRRSKNGFHTPIRDWIRESPDLLDATVHSASFRDHGVFDQTAVRTLFTGGMAGEALAQHALRWITTELWLQECIDAPAMVPNVTRASYPVAPAA